MRKHLFLYIIVFITSQAPSWGQDVNFTASAPSRVAQGQNFQLVYSLNKSGTDLRLPEIPDFQILIGPSIKERSDLSIINGSVSRNINYSYTYVLKGDKTGRFSIPPATIEIDGKKIESNALTIEVVAKEDQSTSPAQQQGQQAESDAGALSDEDLYITTTANKTEVWQDEPVLITTRIYTRVNLEGIAGIQQPELRNFVVEELPAQAGNIQWELQNVKDKNYRVGTFTQRVLYAQTSGRHTVDPTTIEFLIRQRQARQSNSIFGDYFESYRTVKKNVRSKPITIQVKALPSPRPANFSGIVGNVTLNVSASKTEAKVNDGITLKAEITGTGNHRLAKNPEFEVPSDFDVFDPQVTNSIQQTSQGGKGTRTVETLIIPRHSGTFEIPAVAYSFFNPSTGRYQTLESKPITINVERSPGEEISGTTGSPVGATNRESVRYLGQDIRYIKTEPVILKPANTFLFGSTLYILSYLLPIVLFVLLFVFNQKRIKENSDVQKVKNRKANKMARKRLKKSSDFLKKGNKEGFYEELTRALWGYTSDKLSIPRSALTKDNARSILLENGANANLTEEFLGILDTCEYARYSPQSDHSERDQLYRKTLDTISQLEGQLKRKK
jgi:hypothetical protein